MKKTLALLAIATLFVASPALAMNVDDILELCRAGFEPDRIARIVEAAGMEQPLEASDWSRIKSEGCGDEVVDALLNVLAPMEEVEDEDAYDSGDDGVDVNLYGNWGTNGWYGSTFWGGYSPSWGFGYSAFDPWYDWTWRWHWTSSLWYDPWWCYPHRTAYYCHTWNNPYYYCGGSYTGGYYGGGVYHRQKAARQGGSAKAYRYASAKASPVMTKATYASAKAKPYRGGAVATGMNSNGGAVAIRKSSRSTVTNADGATVSRTKSKTYARGSSVGTGAVKQKGTSTAVQKDNGYAKRKTAVRNGGATSTGNTTSVTRSKTRTKTSGGTSTGTSTTVKRKGSGATNSGSGTSMSAPRTSTKSSGSTYRAPATTGAPRSGSSGSSGTARRKGTK